MRIVRVANFVTPRSGGLRTCMDALGAGYLEAGHEPILVIPGARWSDRQTPAGRVITVPGFRVPGMGGYRVIIGRLGLSRLLIDLAPDRLEVSDRSTLRWTGRWARRRGVGTVMVSHESLYGLLGTIKVPDPLRHRIADGLNARTARDFDAIICTTRWASREFDRIGAANVRRVPLGVDLETFHPSRYSGELRARFAAAHQTLLLHCGRLSTEKRPYRSTGTLAALRAAGYDAVLLVVGDGPLRQPLMRSANGQPVHFLRYVSNRTQLAELLATADAVIAPGPIETFGLAGLEALACGTPVVVDAASALPEVVGAAGVSVHGPAAAAPGDDTVATFADGVLSIMRRPEPQRRAAARCQAERFDWSQSVRGFLAAHGIAHPAPR